MLPACARCPSYRHNPATAWTQSSSTRQFPHRHHVSGWKRESLASFFPSLPAAEAKEQAGAATCCPQACPNPACALWLRLWFAGPKVSFSSFTNISIIFPLAGVFSIFFFLLSKQHFFSYLITPQNKFCVNVSIQSPSKALLVALVLFFCPPCAQPGSAWNISCQQMKAKISFWFYHQPHGEFLF